MAGTGVLAGARQVLIIDEKNLAVSSTDCGDTGIIAGGKRKMFSENTFGRKVFQDASRSVIFVSYDGSLSVQQDTYVILRGVSKE